MIQENKKMPLCERVLCGEFLLLLAGIFIFFGIFNHFNNTIKYVINPNLLMTGVLLAWITLILLPRFRFLIFITGIMGFNIYLAILGIDKIDALEKVPNKETAFIIAVAIIAWLAMSCYVLSLLKDSQSEND